MATPLTAHRLTLFQKLVLILGFSYLYLPMLILMVNSFNQSDIPSIWMGFGTNWYQELFKDKKMMTAAWFSLKIAIASASTAIVIGTAASLTMARFGYFRGQVLFLAMITAPLVIPEIILGLAFLVFFVFLEQITGFPEGRGFLTIWIAHATFTSAYVTVIVAARLRGMDQSIEDAAQDLGATPWKVFWLIVVPIIKPALIASWLLAFTISFDNLVISNFLYGPGSTTLPMVVFSMRMGVNPKINALATIIITVTSTCLFIAAKIIFEQEKRRKHEIKMALENP